MIAERVGRLAGDGSTLAGGQSACPACQCQSHTGFATVATPYLDRRERYRITTCDACGHGQAIGRHDSEFLEKIYSGSFFGSSQQRSETPDSPIARNARQRAEMLRAMAAGRLLDIGAGTGAFLRAARDHFDVEGVEYSASAADMARSSETAVHVGDIMSINLLPGSFDVVTMWDVLASLSDPAATLGKCSRLLKPGGLLVVTVPMIDSMFARLMRSTWPLLIPPVNLHYFTEASIRYLGKAAGFEVLSLGYPRKQVALRFVIQKAASSFGLHRVGERVTHFIPTFGIPVNCRDIAMVFLRRLHEA